MLSILPLNEKIINNLKNRVQKILKSKFLSKDDIRLLTNDAYQVIELLGKKPDFPKIVFYRNWLEHSILNGSIAILEEIERQFDIPEYLENTNDRVAELLSTKSLRAELKSLFSMLGINFPFLDSLEFWKAYLVSLYNQLLSKPLESRNQTEQLKIVKRFSLEVLDNKIHWQVVTISKPDIPIRGLFALNEQQSDFLRP